MPTTHRPGGQSSTASETCSPCSCFRRPSVRLRHRTTGHRLVHHRKQSGTSYQSCLCPVGRDQQLPPRLKQVVRIHLRVGIRNEPEFLGVTVECEGQEIEPFISRKGVQVTGWRRWNKTD